jgi:hypothetical protein
MKYIFLFENFNQIFYHGSTDKMLLGKNGIHVGTYEAARQALNARIGVPAEGDWDGTREYNKTLLAGKKTLNKIKDIEGRFVESGYNCGDDVPSEDYYPERKGLPKYSDGTEILTNCYPIIFPVKIIGNMINTYNSPYSDVKANSIIKRTLKIGNAKNGIYYINIGEDEGSISAVVPDSKFIKIIN